MNEDNKVAYTEIIIDWGPKETYKIDTDNKEGLYQIYGNHPVYGSNTLLYIGMSKDLDSRDKSHLDNVFNWQDDVNFYCGQIKRLPSSLEAVKSLTIPESILIANHKPAFNSEYIHALARKTGGIGLEDFAYKNKIIIINNGNPGMLNKCCTNFWWVDGKEEFQNNKHI